MKNQKDSKKKTASKKVKEVNPTEKLKQDEQINQEVDAENMDYDN